MEQGKIAFTAVYLKATHGYVGFIEELPGVTRTDAPWTRRATRCASSPRWCSTRSAAASRR